MVPEHGILIRDPIAHALQPRNACSRSIAGFLGDILPNRIGLKFLLPAISGVFETGVGNTEELCPGFALRGVVRDTMPELVPEYECDLGIASGGSPYAAEDKHFVPTGREARGHSCGDSFSVQENEFHIAWNQ